MSKKENESLLSDEMLLKQLARLLLAVAPIPLLLTLFEYQDVLVMSDGEKLFTFLHWVASAYVVYQISKTENE